jgi:hypothetical protein
MAPSSQLQSLQQSRGSSVLYRGHAGRALVNLERREELEPSTPGSKVGACASEPSGPTTDSNPAVLTPSPAAFFSNRALRFKDSQSGQNWSRMQIKLIFDRLESEASYLKQATRAHFGSGTTLWPGPASRRGARGPAGSPAKAPSRRPRRKPDAPRPPSPCAVDSAHRPDRSWRSARKKEEK